MVTLTEWFKWLFSPQLSMTIIFCGSTHKKNVTSTYSLCPVTFHRRCPMFLSVLHKNLFQSYPDRKQVRKPFDVFDREKKSAFTNKWTCTLRHFTHTQKEKSAHQGIQKQDSQRAGITSWPWRQHGQKPKNMGSKQSLGWGQDSLAEICNAKPT